MFGEETSSEFEVRIFPPQAPPSLGTTQGKRFPENPLATGKVLIALVREDMHGHAFGAAVCDWVGVECEFA